MAYVFVLVILVVPPAGTYGPDRPRTLPFVRASLIQSALC